jgi:predicted nucleic acid-binding protein
VIILDTTVLVYAVGEAHQLRELSQELLRAIRGGVVRATTTPEVIQEFTHVRARRRPRSDAATLARHFRALLTPLTEVSEGDLDLGLELFARCARLGAFDCVLAAVGLRLAVEAIVSADHSFAELPELRWMEPAAAVRRWGRASGA